MVKPEFLFEKNIKLDVSSFYATLALIGTLMLSIQSILVRLVKDDITNDVLIEYFYLSQIYINGLTFLVFDANSSETVPWVNSCVILFVVIVITGYAGQILNTRSLFMIPASKAMPFRYINVIIGFLIDVFYYALSFDWLSILGILITSLSLAYMTIQKVSKK
jgi:drug/metabolite transporter (DMT)-like permease